MLTHPTLDQLRALKLDGMADAFVELQSQDNGRDLSHAEWLALLLDREAAKRDTSRFQSRLRSAKLRHSQASIEDVDYRAARRLDKAMFQQLATGRWIAEHRNVLVIGKCGVGKSWLSCALAQKACRDGYTVHYARAPRLFAELELARIALQNKAVVYDILLKTAAETIRIIGADPKHLGGETGLIAILHTWGQTLTHHPHAHCVVPGGALAADGRWVGCKPNFFLPVRVLSRLYRRLFLERLQTAFAKAELIFFGNLARLMEPAAFAQYLGPLRRVEWNYAKRPFGGPLQVLEYLGRYTHRVAIANSRLLACENGRVHFRWKDYRAQNSSKVMTLDADEFIRRFLLHVLPKGFRRIRHFGFLANACRTAKLPAIRAALEAPEPTPAVEHADYRERYAILTGRRIDLCPVCGGCMVEVRLSPRSPSQQRTEPRCDTS